MKKGSRPRTRWKNRAGWKNEIPASAPITADPSEAADQIEETVTAGASALQDDAAADQYIYIWKTEKAWAGTSRQFVIKLKDGTDHKANFSFTRQPVGGMVSELRPCQRSRLKETDTELRVISIRF